MRTIFIFFLLLFFQFIFISCKKEYDFWDINKFKIEKNALQDNEEIMLLYASNGPDENQEREYYYHLIVISQKTGDTINVLTTSQNGFNKDSAKEIFNFYDEKNFITIITHNKINMSSLNGKNVSETEKIKLKKINKVARDNDFDYLADNNYPTVIGSIGKTSDN